MQQKNKPNFIHYDVDYKRAKRIWAALCPPGALPAEVVCQDVLGYQNVFDDLEIEHSDAGEIGAGFEGVLEAVPWMDGARGQDFIRDPGLGDVLHELDGLFRRGTPHTIVAGQAGFWALVFRRGGEILIMMQRFHIEIDVDAFFFERYRHGQVVTCHAGDQSVVFDEFDYFCDQVDPAVLDPFVADLALYEGADRPVVDSDFDPAGQVVGLREALRDPLDLSASFVMVLVNNANSRVVAVGVRAVDGGDHCVDSVFFAPLPGLHDFLIGEIMPQQRRDINQITGVGEAVDKVSAADDPADYNVADFTCRQLFAGALPLGGVRFCHRLAQQDFFFQSQTQCRPCRDERGFLKKPSSIYVFCHDLFIKYLNSFIANELGISLYSLGRLAADKR